MVLDKVKVPRSVFEKKYGTGDIISEAMEKIVDAKYGETIVKEKINTSSRT